MNSGKLIFILISLLFFAAHLSAQTEEELDRLLLEENSDTAPEENNTQGSNPFSITGFAELSLDASLSEGSFGDNSFYNTEGRIKLKPEYKIQDTRAYADLDFFTNAGSESSAHEQNSFEISEFFIEGENTVLWKAGKQRFNWGAGDIFQPTNYLDRPDLRQSFMTGQDDRYQGTYALSLRYIRGDYGIEGVFSPVTEPVYAPAGYYIVPQETVSTPAGSITPRYTEQNAISSISESEYAVRGGGTTGFVDWHLVYFTGMNRQLIYSSALVSENNRMYLYLSPVYRRMNAFGGDISFAVEKLNVRLELGYSPDMPAASELTDTKLEGAVTRVVSGSPKEIVQTIQKEQFISYSAGLDYNLWGDYGTVYAEWMQSRYLNEEKIEPLLQTDILTLKAEDSFFNRSVNLSAGSLIRTRDGTPGLAITGEAEYDFKNGLTAKAGTYYFVPNNDEYFVLFEDMNMGYIRLKYIF